MISAKFEDEIWIYFRQIKRCKNTKEYWNVIRSFDKFNRTRIQFKFNKKRGTNYYNSLIEKVNSGRLFAHSNASFSYEMHAHL